MHIGILSNNSKLYSTKRLKEECLKRGHQAEVVEPLLCYMDIAGDNPSVRYKKKVLNKYQALIPRIGASSTYYGLAILRQFEMMGVYSLNHSIAIGRSRDKLRSLQSLSKKGVKLPRTSFAHSTLMTQKLIDLVGGAPVVLKLLEGSQGKGVVLAETNKAAESVIDAFRELDANFLVQEFVKEAQGCDIRCFVIGNKVVASIERRAKEGEFRSNLHRGGQAQEIKITPQERDTAISATRAMGLNVAGVDLLRSSEGPKVMEVNSSPGLEGIETCTGKNIAELIVKFIEVNAAKGSTGIKGIG